MTGGGQLFVEGTHGFEWYRLMQCRPAMMNVEARD